MYKLTQNNEGDRTEKVKATHNAEGVDEVGQLLLPHGLRLEAADIPPVPRHEDLFYFGA